MNHDRVHTLADLDDWRFDGVSLAVLGHPVAHSLSPPMHNAVLAELARRDAQFANWRYFKFDIDPADLPAALARFHARGFRGLNLTIPHKIIAVDLVRSIDATAAAAGSVNTLRRLDHGFEGFTTDGYGISRAVQQDLGTTIADSPVILLGAGGAARATAVTCMLEKCSVLWIGNRTRENLEKLLQVLAPIARAAGIAVHGFDPAQPSASLPSDALVINATSAGLKPGDAPPIDLARIPGHPRVYDMIYNPPVTPLLRTAQTNGLQSANGLSMLVHQGVRSLELWTGQPVPAEVMFDACRAALAARA